jgi:hypothetical protein
MPMLTSLAAALFASSAIAHAGVSETPAAISAPPITVTVSAPTLSASLVREILDEADAIWRGSGVAFVWRRGTRDLVPYERAADTGPRMPATLRLVIDNAIGTAHSESVLPLGWVVFDDATTPEQEIHVSYANALQFLHAARGVVGMVEQMPTRQIERLLGRAMGRALAHELGHYLLASKAHTTHGLMKANRTAFEFFTIDRSGFSIEPAQRQQLVARLRGGRVTG